MTDTDRTNIYSYKGTDYAGDLMAYLTAQGIAVQDIKLVEGIIYILGETKTWEAPQGAQWCSIAEHMGGRE